MKPAKCFPSWLAHRTSIAFLSQSFLGLRLETSGLPGSKQSSCAPGWAKRPATSKRKNFVANELTEFRRNGLNSGPASVLTSMPYRYEPSLFRPRTISIVAGVSGFDGFLARLNSLIPVVYPTKHPARLAAF